MDWVLGMVAACAVVVFALAERRRFPRWSWWMALTSALVAGGGAWSWQRSRTRLVSNQAFLETALPRSGRPDGYVSSDRCQACHPDEYHSWHQTFHRTMTQLAQPDTVRAAFDQVSLSTPGQSFRLTQRGNEFWEEENVSSPSAALPAATGVTAPGTSRRVGMLTGSHHMEMFWIPRQPGNLQRIFPFAYLLDDHRWVPVKDTFLRDPNLLQDDNLWNVDCIQCHTTAGQPRAEAEVGRVETRLGEMGIACESCHGPAKEHVRANANPVRRYVLHLRGSGDQTIINPARLPAKVGSEVCGQCHGIKWIRNRQDFLRNGFRYQPGEELARDTPIVQPTRLASQPWLTEPLRRRPGYLAERFWPDGMVRISGRDYNGLIDAPCYQRGELSCLSCHSMHHSSPTNQLRNGMEGNQACLQCHTKMQGNVAAHTHHEAGSSGSLCYNCHMPRTTYGLLKAIRSHYIESPSTARAARTGRPDGCSLCHLDRSLGWVDQHLVAWYGTKPASLTPEQQTISAAITWALRGDAGQRALAAWHMGWEPARKASGERWLAPFLGQLLIDPYSAVRYIAGHSLERLPGFDGFAYDYLGTPAQREKARQQALAHWQELGATDRTGAEVLVSKDGRLQQDAMSSLLQQRDDRSMDLKE